MMSAVAEEAFTDSPDLELLPADQAEIVDADEQLDAAEASVLDDPLTQQTTEAPVIPYGRTPAFDFAAGRFVRLGDEGIPWVTGEMALREWIQVVLHTGRGGCKLYGSATGVERMDDYLGEADPSTELATFEERLRDALTQHERIEDIDDYEVETDPTRGVVELRNLTIITDAGEAVLVGNFDTTMGV